MSDPQPTGYHELTAEEISERFTPKMPDTDEPRITTIYCTADQKYDMTVDVQRGFILPPVIEAHVPQLGLVKFYAKDLHRFQL